MARLGQQHERRPELVAEIPPDKRMRLVPPRHSFQVLHRAHIPQRARIDDRLDLLIIRGVPQDVADGEENMIGLRCRHDPNALRRRRGHGLFQKDVIALLGRQNGRGRVQTVRSRNHHRVRQPGPGERSSHFGKTFSGRRPCSRIASFRKCSRGSATATTLASSGCCRIYSPNTFRPRLPRPMMATVTSFSVITLSVPNRNLKLGHPSIRVRTTLVHSFERYRTWDRAYGLPLSSCFRNIRRA